METKKRIYIDLDGVMADFDKAVIRRNKFAAMKEVDFFANLEPIHGALEAYKQLNDHYELYLLSTPLWSSPHSWGDKRIWVQKHLGALAHKKLILSHNKGLFIGEYLIDDRTVNGVEDFKGEHIHFGSEKFPNWETVLKYLIQ